MLYLCSRKAARTGCASAIQTSLIAFGLHRPCTVKLKYNEIMEATTARRRHTAPPMSYYRKMVQDMDDSQKLELVSIIIDSLKSAVAPPPMRRYTMDDINAMLDEAEAEIAAGGGIPDEEAWDDLEEELEREEQEELEMMEAV